MVYIYKKIVGEKSYYYLRASKRKGERVIAKDIAYLGGSIKEAKKALSRLTQYNDEIRKSYRRINLLLESNYYLEKAKEIKLKRDVFMGEKILDIEACKIHYCKKFKKEDNLTKQEILRNFVVDFAYNTTSIEGNTILLDEARNLLESGKTPKDRTLREIYDLKNTEKVFLDYMDSKQEITNELIEEIHKNLMENIDSRIGYRIRDVKVAKAHFKSTPGPYVLTDMKLLIKWYNKNKNKLHPLVLASAFHHKFEKIHPFMDGNGRTGRMIMNLILANHDYPPVIVYKKFRSEYLDVLGIADKSKPLETNKEDYSKLAKFISDQMNISYWGIFL
jgi:fido (protein-threonine AMPylation protein)